MAAKCPKCGFHGVGMSRDGSLVCTQCNHSFQQQLSYPPPPRHRPGSSGGTSSARGFIIAGVVGAVVLMSVVSVFIGSSESSHAPEDIQEPHLSGGTGPTSPEVTPPSSNDYMNDFWAELEQESTAPEDLEAALEYTGASGWNGKTAWWILKYTNTGDTPLGTPKVRTRVFNENALPLAENVSIAWLSELPPGESVYMLAQVPDSAQGRAEFQAVELNSIGTNGRATKLDVRDVAVLEREGSVFKDYPWLTGRVVNSKDVRAYGVRVFAIGRDAGGSVVSYAYGMSKKSSLETGESAEFKLSTGVWQTQKPARWEVVAWAKLSK